MSQKILVIEDEPQMRRNISRVRELEGFVALTAEDGREGVAVAKRELPALILCDVMMPALDGYGVLSALRSEPATAAIPFLFLTAKGEKADLRLGMNSGADDYLTKPVDIPDLLAAVHARLDRQQLLEATLQKGPCFDSAKPLETRLGLTPREAEVLFWAAQGKTNAEIAVILSASDSTVKKHLEHIYAKLDVENRSAAALCAIEVLSTAGP